MWFDFIWKFILDAAAADDDDDDDYYYYYYYYYYYNAIRKIIFIWVVYKSTFKIMI